MESGETGGGEGLRAQEEGNGGGPAEERRQLQQRLLSTPGDPAGCGAPGEGGARLRHSAAGSIAAAALAACGLLLCLGLGGAHLAGTPTPAPDGGDNIMSYSHVGVATAAAKPVVPKAAKGVAEPGPAEVVAANSTNHRQQAVASAATPVVPKAADGVAEPVPAQEGVANSISHRQKAVVGAATSVAPKAEKGLAEPGTAEGTANSTSHRQKVMVDAATTVAPKAAAKGVADPGPAQEGATNNTSHREKVVASDAEGLAEPGNSTSHRQKAVVNAATTTALKAAEGVAELGTTQEGAANGTSHRQQAVANHTTTVANPAMDLRGLGPTDHLCYKLLDRGEGMAVTEQGNEVGKLKYASVQDCTSACNDLEGCKSFTACGWWNMCFLKDKLLGGTIDFQMVGFGCQSYMQVACTTASPQEPPTTVSPSRPRASAQAKEWMALPYYDYPNQGDVETVQSVDAVALKEHAARQGYSGFSINGDVAYMKLTKDSLTLESLTPVEYPCVFYIPLLPGMTTVMPSLTAGPYVPPKMQPPPPAASAPPVPAAFTTLASCQALGRATLSGLSIFCFALVASGSRDMDLMRGQLLNGAGIAACDEHVALSDRRVRLTVSEWTWELARWEPRVGKGAMPGELTVRTHQAAWTWIAYSYAWRVHSFVVKVHIHTVFVACELKQRLHAQTTLYQAVEAEQGTYLRTCPGQAQATPALELLSQRAMQRFLFRWPQRCTEVEDQQSEATWLQACLMKVNVTNWPSDLLADISCAALPERTVYRAEYMEAEASAYVPCAERKPAFYPLPSSEAWAKCWGEAGSVFCR